MFWLIFHNWPSIIKLINQTINKFIKICQRKLLLYVKSYIKVEKLILPQKKRKRLICNIREFSKIVVHRNWTTDNSIDPIIVHVRMIKVLIKSLMILFSKNLFWGNFDLNEMRIKMATRWSLTKKKSYFWSMHSSILTWKIHLNQCTNWTCSLNTNVISDLCLVQF